ncbi:MAG: xanthine dehydrogenase molybdopterin binding subunit [Robiginitomaculum sp.]|nr:MAG: xanthine dehydrogenase molybdopterin binding subunit [Robiginitomaculum sp.]
MVKFQGVPHDSAHKHVTGEAIYVDDLPCPPGLLHLQPGLSKRAHAKITKLDLSAVRAAPGVVCVLTAKDIPGTNDVSPTGTNDDPVFAMDEVVYAGQAIFAVAATSLAAARHAATLAIIEYEDLPVILTIPDARAAKADLEPEQLMFMGSTEDALRFAPHVITGNLRVGGQDHFYLESQAAQCIPGEDGDMTLTSSTQHPSEAQHLIAHLLNKKIHDVRLVVRRMGGGFGGKETQAALIAAMTALASYKTGRPARLVLDRDDDMVMTGKRHDFEIDYKVGFDDRGQLSGIFLDLASRCGCSMDLSAAINDRAMFHADNAYFLNNADITSRRFRTNTVSNTAFRGFGGPQGMIAIERVMDAIALHLGKDPLEVRKVNLYNKMGRDFTPYGQRVMDNVAPQIIEDLEARADYAARRKAVRVFNDSHSYVRRGIALTPVKFGISFTTTFLNQAGALVHIYTDGSVHLNHGGTEMGQGLNTKIAQIVAEEFQIDFGKVKITATDTDKVPNTSATAASSGTDLNGMAAQRAAQTIKIRLVDFAARDAVCNAKDVVFENGHVRAGTKDWTFEALVKAAYMARISLSGAGFYATPDIHYDREKHTGTPFYYYAYGAALSEVEVDLLTGESRILRVDIVHDVGKSLNPALDIGQIEGGFVQGAGWLTSEELVFDDQGVLRTHAPSTYKIPACADRPPVFNVTLYEDGENTKDTIHKSKAVGEPPLMLAISVFSAITDAVASVGDYKTLPDLHAPATPEAILRAVTALQEGAKK